MLNEISMPKPIPELFTENLVITILKPEDFHLLAAYERDNQAHLAKWEPTRDAVYFTDVEIEKRVKLNSDNFILGSSISLVGFDKSRSKIICVCHFSNIVHGVFQACHLGYSIDAREQGKGLMFEMLSTSIEYMFSTMGMHRIMANYMPSNVRSEKLLAKLGFEKEGFAKSYLKIAGSWQDHVLTSKINPSHIC